LFFCFWLLPRRRRIAQLFALTTPQHVTLHLLLVFLSTMVLLHKAIAWPSATHGLLILVALMVSLPQLVVLATVGVAADTT
jgi:hypothetical protein